LISSYFLADHKGPNLEVVTSLANKSKANSKKKSPRLIIAMVHGAFTDGWSWAETFMPHFSNTGIDCYSVSLRGHGQSDGQAMLDLFGLNDFEHDVERFIEHLITEKLQQGDKLVLMGSSMGGLLAQRILARQNKALNSRIKAAVLIGSVPSTGLGTSIWQLLWQSPRLFAELVTVGLSGKPNPKFLGLLAEKPLHKQDSSLVYSHVFKESARALSELAFAPWPAMLSSAVSMPSMKPNLGNLPVLALHGNEDKMVPVNIVSSLPATKLVLLDAIGHVPMMETHWQSATNCIDEFLRQVK
jgi:pimeloyl-ACP methyl ester carboxylesterase